MFKHGWGKASTSHRARQPQWSPLVEAAALSFSVDDALQCDPAEGAVLWMLITALDLSA
jgi:hypothetical protein